VRAGVQDGGGGVEAEEDRDSVEEPLVDEALESPLEPDVPSADPVADALVNIEERLAESQRLIERQADIAAKLHAENQTLRAGELRSAQTALVLSVVRVYDDVSRMAVTAEDAATRSDLGIVADALVDALERNGVDRMAVNAGDSFEPGRHKVAEIETTTDPDADRTVARVVRSGFVWPDGAVVRVTDVAVRKYEAAVPEHPPAEPVD
jgi:molecular chaperone GrpE (heat shock protein)